MSDHDAQIVTALISTSGAIITALIVNRGNGPAADKRKKKKPKQPPESPE